MHPHFTRLPRASYRGCSLCCQWYPFRGECGPGWVVPSMFTSASFTCACGQAHLRGYLLCCQCFLWRAARLGWVVLFRWAPALWSGGAGVYIIPVASAASCVAPSGGLWSPALMVVVSGARSPGMNSHCTLLGDTSHISWSFFWVPSPVCTSFPGRMDSQVRLWSWREKKKSPSLSTSCPIPVISTTQPVWVISR